MGNKNSGKRPSPPKYNKGDLIIDNTRSFLVLGNYRKEVNCNNRIKHKLYYQLQCTKCGAVFDMESGNLLSRKDKCPCCSGKRVFIGINDLNTVRPDLTIYLLNKKDGELYTRCANKYIDVKCPNCGYTRKILISQLTNHGFSCPLCSDGISYPNKFVRAFLNQLHIDCIYEYSPDWGNGKRYDCYIPNYNMIIENHGMQHFDNKDTLFSLKNAENDLYKKNLAISNNIDKYIELDCRYSSCDYIRNAIMKSVLPIIFQFVEHDIDWLYCDKMATKSYIYETSKLFDMGYNAHVISEILGISVSTATNYITKANELNLLKTNRYRDKNIVSKYITYKDQMFDDYQYYKILNPDYDYIDIANIIGCDAYKLRDIVIEADISNNDDIYSDIKNRKNNSLSNLNKRQPKKQVFVYDQNNQLLGIYDSAYDAEVASEGKWTAKGIQKVCSGYQKSHRGLIFTYS